jgi:hypothetical protein
VEGDLCDGVIGIAIEEAAAEGAIGRSSICVESIQDIGWKVPILGSLFWKLLTADPTNLLDGGTAKGLPRLF